MNTMAIIPILIDCDQLTVLLFFFSYSLRYSIKSKLFKLLYKNDFYQNLLPQLELLHPRFYVIHIMEH